ncbi:MAG TPA: heme biosynthesis HemY N-terminal domain-containing protein [Coxiellaceae bacterium]|nr:heme biosynthesis HemY N-terminal domain-containing protein [Coxiellaceae bacterium]
MWKLILSVTLLLVFSFCLGWAIKQDPGYILIMYNHWSIETSLWFGLASVFVLILLLYWAYKLIKHTFILHTHIAHWSLNRKQKAADLETAYGLCELLEAHWDKAERKLIKSAKYMGNPFNNYVGAAIAAQQQKKFTERDQYLQRAQAALRGSDMAIELLKARLQMESGQSISALHGLQNLQTKNVKHPATNHLLKELYLELKDWPALLNLLPALNKHLKLNEVEMDSLSFTSYSELLKHAAANNDAALVEQAWLAIPNSWKTNPELLAIYAAFYINNDAAETVVKLIEDNLKKNWNENLVRLYGLAITRNTAKQLKLAEGWLKQHPRDANLLLSLGRLSAREQLWGKAQDYFNASISIDPKPLTYWELAKIQEQLNRLDAAQESYKKGLTLIGK